MTHLKAVVCDLDHTALVRLYVRPNIMSWALGVQQWQTDWSLPSQSLQGSGAAVVVEDTVGLASFKVPGPLSPAQCPTSSIPLVMLTDSFTPSAGNRVGGIHKLP